MYSFSQVQYEIGKKIELAMQQNAGKLLPTWITQAVMADHPDILGLDFEFHLCCSRMAVRKEATQQINKLDTSISESQQLTFEGFDHLHQYYVIGKGDDRAAIRIDLLTDVQLEEKAAEYLAMGQACLAHAYEIQRYVTIRKAQQGQASQLAEPQVIDV